MDENIEGPELNSRKHRLHSINSSFRHESNLISYCHSNNISFLRPANVLTQTTKEL
jgi:hypothetical protein